MSVARHIKVRKSAFVVMTQFPARRRGEPSTNVMSLALFACRTTRMVPSEAGPVRMVVQLSVAAADSVSIIIMEDANVNTSLASVAED